MALLSLGALAWGVAMAEEFVSVSVVSVSVWVSRRWVAAAQRDPSNREPATTHTTPRCIWPDISGGEREEHARNERATSEKLFWAGGFRGWKRDERTRSERVELPILALKRTEPKSCKRPQKVFASDMERLPKKD